MLEFDNLSNLPSDITNHILSYLSIREAVRTSALSSNWRHKWGTLQHLVFDDSLAIRRHNFEEVIDRVLLLHKGPIETFKLSGRRYILDYDLDKWILYLSRFSIKEFTLESRHDINGKISSYLFSYKDLTHLGLRNCSLNPPLTFKGFAMLKSLDIRNVIVAQDVLEIAIAGCPLLQRMILCDLESISSLKVDAPNLQILKVVGDFEEIKLQNAPNLVEVSVGRNTIDSENRSSKLLQNFLSLPRIERLTVEGFLLEQCAVSSISLVKKLPEPYPCLNLVSISMRSNNLDDISVAMYLLRSSPALQVLEIVVRQEHITAGEEATSWLSNNRLWEFTQLRRLNVTGFSAVTGDIDFLDYLCLSSPALQELEISFKDNKQNFLKKKKKKKKKDNKQNMRMGSLEAAVVDDRNRICFDQLRVIKLTNFRGVKEEVGFIRFLLSSSPMLKTMTLQPAAQISWELLELVIGFKSYSAHAELKVLEPLSEYYDGSHADVWTSAEPVPIAAGWDVPPIAVGWN